MTRSRSVLLRAAPRAPRTRRPQPQELLLEQRAPILHGVVPATTFHALAPADERLLPLLDAHKVEIRAAPPAAASSLRQLVFSLLISFLPILVIVGAWIWLSAARAR